MTVTVAVTIALQRRSKMLQIDRLLLKPMFTWRYQDPSKEPVEAAKDPRWSLTSVGGAPPRYQPRCFV